MGKELIYGPWLPAYYGLLLQGPQPPWPHAACARVGGWVDAVGRGFFAAFRRSAPCARGVRRWWCFGDFSFGAGPGWRASRSMWDC